MRYPDPNPVFHPLLANTLHSLELAVGRAFVGEHTENFPNIPYPFNDFVKLLQKAIEVLGRDDFNFIDLGCGTGTKCHCVRQLYPKSTTTGVDINENYLKIAKILCHRVVNFDIIDYVQTDEFKNFDVIYWYEPIGDKTKYRQFCQKVFDNANSKAVLMPCRVDLSLNQLGHWKKMQAKIFGNEFLPVYHQKPDS